LCSLRPHLRYCAYQVTLPTPADAAAGAAPQQRHWQPPAQQQAAQRPPEQEQQQPRRLGQLEQLQQQRLGQFERNRLAIQGERQHLKRGASAGPEEWGGEVYALPAYGTASGATSRDAAAVASSGASPAAHRGVTGWASS